MTTDPLGGARETLEARLKAAEKHAEAIWNALSRDEQIRLYHHEGLGLDPIIGPLREAADALRATGAEALAFCETCQCLVPDPGKNILASPRQRGRQSRQSWLPSGFSFLSGLPEAARKKRLLMPVQVYVDDSGGKGQGRYLVSVGLLAHSEQWAIFADEWKACLERPPAIEYFKMREAFNRVEQFRHFSEPERNAKLLALAKIINEHVRVVFFSSIDLDAHADTWAIHCTKPMNEPFFWTFHNTIHAAMFELWDMGWREQFEIIFDENVIFGPRAKAYYPAIRAAMKIREPEASVLLPADPMFRSDLSFLPIQASDFIAWAGRRDAHFPNDRPFPWLDGVITKPYVSDYSQFYDRERMEAVLKESRQNIAAFQDGTASQSAVAAADEFKRMRDED